MDGNEWLDLEFSNFTGTSSESNNVSFFVSTGSSDYSSVFFDFKKLEFKYFMGLNLQSSLE